MKKILSIFLLVFLLVITGDFAFAQKGPKHKHSHKHDHKHEKHSGKKGKGPPDWAPAHGYRAKTRHIYFPDHETYYDVKKGVYISYKNGKWEVNAHIPSFLKNVNLNLAQQVELDLDTDHPEQKFKEHKTKYSKKKK